jgi:hypothetical protein
MNEQRIVDEFYAKPITEKTEKEAIEKLRQFGHSFSEASKILFSRIRIYDADNDREPKFYMKTGDFLELRYMDDETFMYRLRFIDWTHFAMQQVEYGQDIGSEMVYHIREWQDVTNKKMFFQKKAS